MPDKPLMWSVETMFGYNTRTGRIQLLRAGEEVGQFSINEARDLALNLLQGAEAAEQEQFLYDFAQYMELDQPQFVSLLRKVREFRHRRRATEG